jgi:2-(3-amino-3-carboxypropyl)histidine synthase
MDKLFIEGRSNQDITLPVSALTLLPKKLALLTTVQHAHKIEEVKKFLEINKKRVTMVKGIHSRYPGQILGCDILRLPKPDIDAFLYIGTGEFHPKELLLTQAKPVFVYNPLSKKLYQLKDSDIEKLKRRQKGSLIRFLSSTNIGVLITTKPGQCNLEPALKLKALYPDKSFFFIVFDTIDFQSLENFPFIECFLNTACPRIGYEDQINLAKPILNIDELTRKR